MTVSDRPLAISCEFYPPKSEAGAAALARTRQALLALQPEFYSVTFGAGGTTREGTYETVRDICGHDPVPGVPHLSCITETRANLEALLLQYRALGVGAVVALRGDRPSGMMGGGAFRHANELVQFIRQQEGERLRVYVACYPETHPEARNPETDLANFQRKVEAGADAAISQYFYNADGYFDFVERCRQRKIDIPIIPGILPITNYAQLARFSDICGAEIPRWVRGRLELYQDDTASLKAFGLDVVTALVERLLDGGVPALHFYTLNQSALVLEICRRLGLVPQS